MATAAIGHNQPPEPWTLFAESIADLLIEAGNYLDGKEIETEEQEQAVASIMTRLRRERNGADEQRKVEKRPHDEAAAAVQTKWNPMIGKADTALSCAKSALAVFLRKKEAAQQAAAKAAIEEARKQADAAAEAAQQAKPDDLAGQTTVRVLQENAAAAAKVADRLGKAKVQAKGGERAVSLRTYYTAQVTDPLAFGKWAWEHRRAEYQQFLEDLAQRECGAGPKGIPGVTVHEERKAV